MTAFAPTSPPVSAVADRLLLFTKPARPGRVKTRLVGALTPEQAAELHAAFVGDVCERLAGGAFETRIAWALEEGETLPAGPFPGERQEGADLGERLYRGLAAAARDAERVAAVGSDHPDLPLAAVEDAFGRLRRRADVVLGPAADGGYYLIALGRAAVDRELFRGVPWSTAEVLDVTVGRAAVLGLAVELLPVAADVDLPADLERLAARLAASPEPPCPRTRRLLAAWGMLAAGTAS